MIQANELRVENWITHNNPNLAPKYIRVHSIGEKGINYWPNVEEPAAVKIEFATLEPIPLTPEILEKAGFKDPKHNFEGELVLEATGEITGKAESIQIWNFYFKNFRMKIDYVHQLQNIIHSLTGTELEINLNP